MSGFSGHRHLVVTLLALMLGPACDGVEPDPSPDQNLKASAERWLRSVYGCSPAGIEELASPAVKLSYPIFESLFGTQVISGVAAVKDFSNRFCSRWAKASITIHEALREGDRVVLVWEFSATDLTAAENAESGRSWGGVSFFRFDERRRVLEEFGEESTPGPAARMATPQPH